MILFKMVKYHKKEYPAHIPLNIQEVAGHFDVTDIQVEMPYSLHTEYSYGKREFKNVCLAKYDSICEANKDGIPKLWYTEQWVKDFASFLLDTTKNITSPSVIEIHPPFSDYCDLPKFINRYKLFENLMLSAYPNTHISIENRYGSLYRGGRFIFSSLQSLLELSEDIKKNNFNLRITLDIPQLLAAHNEEDISKIFNGVKEIRDVIEGIHLWGKKSSNKRGPVAHCGDLNSYFDYDDRLKQEFLNSFSSTFNDDLERFMVLEVNSSSTDVFSIVSDLETVNCKFM